MSEGHKVPLSLPRRWICDLLHCARQVPTVPVERRIDVGAVVDARAQLDSRPGWAAIFTRAYGLVAREIPALRRSYLQFPWPHLYEYPVSKAFIVVERDHRGEIVVCPVSIKDPAHQSLQDIGHQLRLATIAPVEDIKGFRVAMQLTRLPRPLRRALWWLGLNIGRQRGNFFGTFAVSVYSALGAESLHPLAPLTTLLNYGVMSSDGVLDVRIIYDHRVMNGVTVARALLRLEEILNSVILDEVRSLSPRALSTA